MAIEITWSEEAQSTFDENISYLQKEWSDREIANFINHTNQILKRQKIFPESYPVGVVTKKYRKAKLNKHIVLFYSYRKAAKKITLITFWNVKKNPSKMTF